MHIKTTDKRTDEQKNGKYQTNTHMHARSNYQKKKKERKKENRKKTQHTKRTY
jgi:hypothetical protein